ncbi:hypothetical protein KIPB_015506, partial [Kipferlia bialata]
VIARLDRLIADRIWILNTRYKQTQELLAFRREWREMKQCEEAWTDAEVSSHFSPAEREAFSSLQAALRVKADSLYCKVGCMAQVEETNLRDAHICMRELKELNELKGTRRVPDPSMGKREEREREGKREETPGVGRRRRSSNISPYRPSLFFVQV